jgi:hypothetical protein
MKNAVNPLTSATSLNHGAVFAIMNSKTLANQNDDALIYHMWEKSNQSNRWYTITDLTCENIVRLEDTLFISSMYWNLYTYTLYSIIKNVSLNPLYC